MLTNNVKQLFLFIFVGLIVVSCDNDSSNPLTPDTHTDAEGLILERDGTEVYREFEGSVVLNDLNLTVNDPWNLTVHFLDHDGMEIEHEEEEHDEGEEEDELSFTSYDDTIILLEVEALKLTNLIYEQSSDGNMFPHLYSELNISHVYKDYEISISKEGDYILPF